jgi:hypothetical protein
MVTPASDVGFSEGINESRGHAVMLHLVRRGALPLLMMSLVVGAACADGSPAAPGTALGRNSDGRAQGPSGLEQRIVTTVREPSPGSPYTALLTVTSTITNTGSTPVRLVSRVCFFQESDFEATAQLDRFEPLISCAAVSMEGDLAPGQSTPAMTVQFGVRSKSGTYTLKLRHALSPEFRGEVTFRVP